MHIFKRSHGTYVTNKRVTYIVTVVADSEMVQNQQFGDHLQITLIILFIKMDPVFNFMKIHACLFTAGRCASAVYAMAVCLSMCMCLSITSRSSTATAQWIELIFGMELPSTYPTLCSTCLLYTSDAADE